MNLPDAGPDNTAVLLAIDYDGELIGMVTDDNVPRDDIVAWLHRIADDFDADAFQGPPA